MSDAFLSDRMMNTTIPSLRARGLETKIGIDGRTVAFDRNGTAIGALEVIVKWAGRQPERVVTQTTDVIGVAGDLHGRPAEVVGFIEAGDRFQLDGNPCEVTRDPVNNAGVGIIPFRLTAEAVS